MEDLKINLETAPEWIQFIGDSIQLGEEYKLSASNSGSFTISRQDVKFEGNKIFIKVKAKVTVTLDPSEEDPNLLSHCNCKNTIPGTGRDEIIPKFGCETKCFGVILICYYCIYGPGGVLKGEESSICGACIGFPF